MSRLYHVHEFAELAGVTVKALHHYDRLGLLTPTRTDAGYRMYADADLERLEHILALKFLGFSLKQVRAISERTTLELAEALRWQRKAIEDKQAHLGRALRAIRAAEHTVDSGQPVDPAILKRIIEVINVQHDIELMKRYYSEEAWERRRQSTMRQRIAEFNLEDVTAFIQQAARSSPKKYFNEEVWATYVVLRNRSPEEVSRSWQARVDLFRDVESALGEDPAGELAQALAARWRAQMDDTSGGNPGVKAGLMKQWADRPHWPVTLRWQMVGLSMMSDERFEKAADFIDAAVAADARGLKPELHED